MYVSPNFKTKKALKEAVAAGLFVTAFNPGLGGEVQTGDHSVEGPHYPDPHSWYARIRTEGDRVVKVLG